MNLSNILTSWKTSVAGLFALICGGTHYLQLLPPQYADELQAACTLALAVGLIAAKDGNVSHTTGAVTTEPKAMTATLLLLVAVGLTGLASCSQAQLQKEQAVIVQVRADAQTVLVQGCKDLPAMEVLVGVVTPLVPQLAASGPAIAVGEGVANKLCAVVAAQAAAAAPAK